MSSKGNGGGSGLTTEKSYLSEEKILENHQIVLDRFADAEAGCRVNDDAHMAGSPTSDDEASYQGVYKT
jgi:hypothetical protein